MVTFQVRFFQVVWLYVSFMPSMPPNSAVFIIYMNVGQSHLQFIPTDVHLFVEF